MLKQCGQLATIVRAPASFSVSMFCWASMLNTNSLPIRRAGSPVQVSAGPSTANDTPAVCSSSAMALVVLRARSSSAPAQPTQNRYCTSSPIGPSTTGTSKSRPSAQSSRRDSPMPHGSPLFSRFFSMVDASAGNADSISTWCRRMSVMWSMCSMSTGHSCTQAPQLVQDQSTSGWMTPLAFSSPTSGRSASALTRSGSCSRSSSEPASSHGALARAWSRWSMISSLGDSGLPVAQAGHCDWQRPHSVQAAMSSSDFQDASSILPRPNTSVSGSASSKSSTLPLDRIGSSPRRPLGRRANSTFSGARKMCRCLE